MNPSSKQREEDKNYIYFIFLFLREEKTYVDPQTGRIICGHAQGTIEQKVESTEMLLLRPVAANHIVYQEFAAQQAEGHQLSAQQLKFMEEHKRLLSMHNLKVDEKGNAVFDDEKFKERAGLNSKTSCKKFIKAQEKSSINAGNAGGDVKWQMLGTRFNWKNYIKGR